MTTPSPEHVEHVARAINPVAFGPQDTSRLPTYYLHLQYEAKQAATRAILSSQDWLEKNGADKEG